jgi:hypothetical protein
MKNLFTCITLFIGASILFSSCSHQDLALTKRHYRNGYYVERSAKPADQKTKAQEPVDSEQPVTVSEEAVEPKMENNLLAGTDNLNKTVQGDIAQDNSTIKSADHTGTNKSIIPHFSILDSKKNTPKTFLENKFSANKMLRSSGSGGHGLLWTIIVILLILWLIAFLMGGWGLGNLLWLILVVALVLLILRLLGLF